MVDSDSESPDNPSSLKHSNSANSIMKSGVSKDSGDKNLTAPSGKLEKQLTPPTPPYDFLASQVSVKSIEGVLDDETQVQDIFKKNCYLRLLSEHERIEVKSRLAIVTLKKGEELVNERGLFEFFVVAKGKIESFRTIDETGT